MINRNILIFFFHTDFVENVEFDFFLVMRKTHPSRLPITKSPASSSQFSTQVDSNANHSFVFSSHNAYFFEKRISISIILCAQIMSFLKHDCA